MAPHPHAVPGVNRGSDVVEHLCPECGYAPRADCWACPGNGRLTEQQMDAYLARIENHARLGLVVPRWT